MLKLNFKVVEDQNIYTGGPKKKICEVNNEETKVQTDKHKY